MGNHISNSSSSTGKVILLDGSIQEFDKPLNVAELMLEYPQQVVVELNSTSVTPKKPTPLPADKYLEIDKFYLMVPLKRGKPAHLSSQQAHHILVRANAVIRSKTMVTTSKFLPFFATICAPSTLNSNDSYCKIEVVKKEIVGSDEKEKEEFYEGDESRDHLSRQFSGRNWKPSLDTIEERKDEIKRGKSLVKLASMVVKRIESKGLVWG